MESDPFQSNLPPFSPSPITKYDYKDLPVDERCKIFEYGLKENIFEISGLKDADEINKKVLYRQAESADALKAQNAKLKEIHETEKATLQAENTQLQTTLVEKQEIINQYAEDAKKQETENAQLKESNEKLHAENLGLKNVIASLQKSVETTEKEKVENESKIFQLTRTLDTKEAEINRFKDQTVSLQTTLGTSVASISQLQNEKLKLKQELSHINDTKNALNFKVCEKAVKMQKLEAEIRQLKNQNAALTKENALFVDAGGICKIEDVLVNGKIDHVKLNGKTLIVDKLLQKSYRWYADDYEISFENQNFKVFVKEELYLESFFDTVFYRVRLNNLKRLCIFGETIAYSDFKQLISSCNNIYCLTLRRITVEDENGKIIEIDQLLKDISETNCNIEQIFYIFKLFEVPSENVFAQLPSFSNVGVFIFSFIHDGFDLKDFGEFIKKNPNVNYELIFSCSYEFYAQIKNIEKELRPTLPLTCKLEISKL